MKKFLIILLLITPFHASQALSFSEVVDSVKELMPWYESAPKLTFELTDKVGTRIDLELTMSIDVDLELTLVP